jgi:CRISPR-associated exonuclease Cas4
MEAIRRARAILESGMTPAACYESAKCDRCSLFDLCMPQAVDGGGKRVSMYIQSEIASIRKECD